MRPSNYRMMPIITRNKKTSISKSKKERHKLPKGAKDAVLVRKSMVCLIKKKI
jgi:hypothetical protein